MPARHRRGPGRSAAYTEIDMPHASVEELRGKISTGEYAIDSGKLAADILSKFALIRRVRRRLTSDEEAGAATEARRTTNSEKGPYFRAPRS
jgi:hypothetical protein